MATFNFGQFVRECYLRSNPSVDLNLVPEGVMVDCCKHTLLVSEYENILAEFHINDDERLMLGCAMWMLQSGPQLKQE